MPMPESGELPAGIKIDYTAHDKLQQTKASIEKIVAEMLSVKREGKPQPELRELVSQAVLDFITLRQVNRTILLQEDQSKIETEHAKAPIDMKTLQVQSLMYEKNHYVKAIKACKDFNSKYPEIELVSEETFTRDAPEEIKSSVVSGDNAHNLMLKRLNFELFQRKELCNARDKLEQKKKALQATIANQKKFLSGLPSNLKALKKASLPLQHQLGVPDTKKMKQEQSVELLPPPLYVIFFQLWTEKEAFGEFIDLEIVGSIKEAQAFARQHANKHIYEPMTVENSKSEDELPDEKDDGQRQKKRPKKASALENLGQTGTYEAHPLKVILHINDDEALDQGPARLITLMFEYLMTLNVVCVGIEGSEGPDESILCNLFPDDAGLELPHQTAKLCIGDGISFDERRTCRPYKWAQHLAGIDFLPDVPPLITGSEISNTETTKHAAVLCGKSLYHQQKRVQTVVQRIRAQRKAQLALHR